MEKLFLNSFKQHHEREEHINFEEGKNEEENIEEMKSGNSNAHFEEKEMDIKDVLSSNNIDLAITGPAFKFLREQDISLFTNVILKCNIFARMKPFQKASLIDYLKDKNFTVGKNYLLNLSFFFFSIYLIF